ncbi:MAG TPA: GntR family transcriptional regulator, partial [Chthonomonadaceae bacterium]|nr:GntR family transcriptional regulator [Chthonomonadaceae bacterium]
MILQRFPASVRVRQTLQERIAQGTYPAGAWLPTERELASEFAVSRQVIRATIADLLERGLIVREPGCRPRVGVVAAASPVGGERTARGVSRPSIAVVMGLSPGFVCAHAILRGISAALRQREEPNQLMVCDTQPAPGPSNAGRSEADWERVYLERVADEGAAGVIFWHNGEEQTLPILRRLQQNGVPVVLIDRISAGFDCDFVGVDNRAGVKEAVAYLLGLGHRRIAYITNPEQVTTVEE